MTLGPVKKKQISVNIFTRQNVILSELVRNKVYDNRSEIVRMALDFFFNSELIKALRKKNNEIVLTLKDNHNGYLTKNKIEE